MARLLRNVLTLFVLVAVIAAVGNGGGDLQAQVGADPMHHWILKSQRPVIIGGYGDNFNYDGFNVRPLNGFAVLDLDTASKAGKVVATLQTTPESGPLYVASNTRIENGIEKVTHEYLDGEIRLEMVINADDARFQEFEWLHGNTGNEAPVMPDIFNFLAGWAPINVFVNNELAYENLVGHFMYTEQARRDDYTIRRDDGSIYSPTLEDKSRFTNPDGREFHLVAHSNVPDEGNFPPHTQWIHLVFFDVFPQQVPAGADVSSN
jgi:hypothetical protein